MLLLLAMACTGIQSVPPLKDDSGDSGAGTGPVGSGDVEVRPGRLDFGEVEVGSGRERDVTIRNTGESPISLDISLDGAAFTTSTTTLEVEGESVVSIGFQPQSERDFEGTLRINGGDAGEAEVALTGTGGTGGGTGDDSGGTTPAGGPDIDISSASYDFGQVDVGQLGQYSFVFYNTGDDDLLISEIRFSNGVFSNGGGSLQLPQVLSPGSNRVLTVNFAPSQTQNYSAEMTVVSDDPDEGSLRVQLEGEGVDLCDICSPILEVDPVTVNFFLITAFGMSDSQSVTLTNVGDQDLDIRNVTITNDFIATCGTFSSNFRNSQTLRPNASTSFDVTWRVSGSCLELDQASVGWNVLEVESNDPSSPFIMSLTGEAL